MRNPVFFEDTTVVWRITFYNDDLKTAPVDPSVVAFRLKSPAGATIDVTPDNETGTGKWSAKYIVNQFGDWQWHWQTETPRIIDQGIITVIKRNVA